MPPLRNPVLAAIPADEDLRRKSAAYQIVGSHASRWGDLFAALGDAVAVAPPVRPKPLSQDELWACSTARIRRRCVVLEPATDADMRGKNAWCGVAGGDL